MAVLRYVFYVWAVCAYMILGVWCAHSAPVGKQHFWKMCLGWPIVLAVVAAMVPVLAIQMFVLEAQGWMRKRSKP